MKLFVDTWGWVAIADRRDAGHEAATEIFRQARRSGGAITSNFILDETFTLLFQRRPFEDAWHFTTNVVQSPFIDVQEVTSARFSKSIELRKQFSDKPRISFTDSFDDGDYAGTRDHRYSDGGPAFHSRRSRLSHPSLIHLSLLKKAEGIG